MLLLEAYDTSLENKMSKYDSWADRRWAEEQYLSFQSKRYDTSSTDYHVEIVPPTSTVWTVFADSMKDDTYPGMEGATYE